jgi:hypothetical protein
MAKPGKGNTAGGNTAGSYSNLSDPAVRAKRRQEAEKLVRDEDDRRRQRRIRAGIA